MQVYLVNDGSVKLLEAGMSQYVEELSKKARKSL